eukprot:357902-Chlamydomonas_euryale.AAC.20
MPRQCAGAARRWLRRRNAPDRQPDILHTYLRSCTARSTAVGDSTTDARAHRGARTGNSVTRAKRSPQLHHNSTAGSVKILAIKCRPTA